MGWTSNKKLRGESHLRFLRRTSSYYVGAKWPGETPELEYQVTALQPGRGGVYGIIRLTDSSRNIECQFGLVIQFETLRGDTQFKQMTEMDGPVLSHMPEKLFRRLTPVDQLPFPAKDIEHCRDWRARCQKLIDNRNALRPGVRFTTWEGIPFGNSGSVTNFEVQDLTSRIFMANPGTPNAFRVRLSLNCIDELNFTVNA